MSDIQKVITHDLVGPIPDMLDHKQALSVRFSDHNWNIGPFDNRTQIYYLNTRLVQYSDSLCIGLVRY